MEKVFILVILIATVFDFGSTKKVCIQVGDAMSFAIEAPTDGKLHVNIPYKYKGLPLSASEIEDGEPIDLNSMFQCKVKTLVEPTEKILPKYELSKETTE